MRNELTQAQADTAALQSAIEIEHIKLTDELAALVRDKRRIKKWEQKTLIEKVPVGRGALINIEQGRGNPELKTILAVAMTMGYKVKIDLVRQ